MDFIRQYFGLIAPLIVLQLVLMVLGLRDLIPRKPEEVTGGSKWLWGVVVVVLNTLGPLAYFAFGRKRE